MAFDEISALNDLTTELTAEDIIRIKNEIGLPEGLCKDITQGSNFINAMEQWKGRDPYKFYLAIQHIRLELTPVACRIKWLCVSSPEQTEYKEEEVLSIKTLIELMKSEISKANWELIYMVVTGEAGENVNFEITLNKLLEKGLIDRKLSTLKVIMKEIQRNDLIEKLQEYQNAFSAMEEGEFESKFKREVNNQAKELKQWQSNLKYFVEIQYGRVQQMLGDEESVNLSEVYIDLTILKQKPKEIDLKDETTYNEIAYLRKIANKEVEIIPVNFTEELRLYKSEKPEIWCLIGNPGCGKTFLAKRTALRFSSNELTGIQYSISVPCRNTDWHSMEFARYENELEIEKEYIGKWLCLGLPKGPNWSKDLAKHITESNGDGILLIIDGLDEFSRKVPFGKTFIHSLLTRESLTKSRIIITTRPGAWTDISSTHELKIDRYYQVLGFSPENRDLYFQKQITSENKLRACWKLMERHDEMKQLSLIPVNASLFAALLKGESSTSINTLTRLYYELTLYMIRRELSRMGLQEFARVAQISYLHEDILDCLYKIGFIAFLGVANRDLVSEENVPLIIGQEEYACQCLGLAHEHYRKESIGLMKKVWTFADLSIQEFVSALYLEHTTWTEQCYSVRYISNPMTNFSLFRMVVRFLCGLLSDKAAAVLSIIYRYLTPQPIQLIDMPMSYQLDYDHSYHHQGWIEFTEIYFQLAATVYETNSNSVPFWYSNFQQYFPNPIYLYIQYAVSPNEWICFIQSLKLVCSIHLIYINTSYINSTQFNSLMQEMRNCSVYLLALYFAFKDATTILLYTDIIQEAEMKFDTKISIELFACRFEPLRNWYLPAICSMRILNNIYLHEFLVKISQQLSGFEYLNLNEFPIVYNDKLIFSICKATQLKGLYFYRLPRGYHKYITTVLPKFSKLEEIRFDNYSLLPSINTLSSLKLLRIEEISRKEISNHYCDLLSAIVRNRDTLKVLGLYSLHKIGFNNWRMFLGNLEFARNLVQLKLFHTSLPTDDVNQWGNLFNNLKLLIELLLFQVTLYDKGFMSMCEGLIYHPAIRFLRVEYCRQTSLSCYPLTHLIPTVSQLETIQTTNLSEPDEQPIGILQKTADEYGIELILH